MNIKLPVSLSVPETIGIEGKDSSKVFFISILLFSIITSHAQDINYARSIVDTLAAPGMHGRGYVNDGDKIAAAYIENEFRKFRLKSFGESYRQEFKMSVNTFPGEMSLKETIVCQITEDQPGGRKPGSYYLVDPSSGSINGKFKVIPFDSAVVNNKKALKRFNKQKFHDKVVIIDSTGAGKKNHDLFKAMALNPVKAKAIINCVPPQLKSNNVSPGAWSVGREQYSYAAINIVRWSNPAASRNILELNINIESEFLPSYTTQNIIGYIPGTQYPDSFIVFSAHYDHLGRMGKDVYFPGANDNASGMAMLLNLAKYYSENKPKYSVAFMAFGAEEAGLVGSKFYTEKPMFPLKQIKFLVNMDLAGTGDDGITVVNGSVFNDEFKYLVKLNAQESLLKDVKVRGKAANSDHYFFTEKGVRAFFIYTMGGIKAYHDIYDRPETLPLTEFEDYFKLLTGFSKYLMNDY